MTQTVAVMLKAWTLGDTACSTVMEHSGGTRGRYKLNNVLET